MKNSSLPAYKLFLSTPSARRATEQARKFIQQTFISIHALREEGDQPTTSTSKRSSYFYPRPPRGGRPHYSRTAIGYRLFLSTPSARRATNCNPLTTTGS